MSAVTDGKPPGRLRPARVEQVAGSSGSGRDTAGGTSKPGTSKPGASKPGASEVSASEVSASEVSASEAGASQPGASEAGGTSEMGASRKGGIRAGAATGVGTAGARAHRSHARPGEAHARLNPAAELGFSGDPEQHGDPDDDMLFAQRTWDASLATNRLDEHGVNVERQRLEIKGVTVSVSLLIDGWPEDVRTCLRSLMDHTEARVLALDLGNVDGAGDVLHELARQYPERIVEWHVAEAPHWRGGTATWSESRAKLLRLDEAEIHVLMETNVALGGDALSPLIAAVVEGAVAAGWKGLEPRSDEDARWRRAGPGRVRALSGDLLAVRRAKAFGALPEDACYGRYADLRLSLALAGELVVPREPLPVRLLERHEADPGYVERESRRNYDGVLRRLRAS
ncbi:hypothetical protein [Nonomuraea insulae]|uniref:Glycosyl transferase family 2 n=1 Tax=Nonomuraea insulae TaxID=1616787 RepID=A0ABW1D0C1_9ACTN